MASAHTNIPQIFSFKIEETPVFVESKYRARWCISAQGRPGQSHDCPERADSLPRVGARIFKKKFVGIWVALSALLISNQPFHLQLLAFRELMAPFYVEVSF